MLDDNGWLCRLGPHHGLLYARTGWPPDQVESMFGSSEQRPPATHVLHATD
jgi:hypothetical protein